MQEQKIFFWSFDCIKVIPQHCLKKMNCKKNKKIKFRGKSRNMGMDILITEYVIYV